MMARDPDPVLQVDPDSLDLEAIAHALQDQGGFEHHWLFDPATGETVYWSDDLDPDEESALDLDSLLPVEPLPSWVWYRDMAEFAEGISDDQAGRRLGRAIRGRGAFRHFKDELHEEYPELVEVWYAWRDARARRRAVEWLRDAALVPVEVCAAMLERHPDPELP